MLRCFYPVSSSFHLLQILFDTVHPAAEAETNSRRRGLTVPLLAPHVSSCWWSRRNSLLGGYSKALKTVMAKLYRSSERRRPADSNRKWSRRCKDEWLSAVVAYSGWSHRAERVDCTSASAHWAGFGGRPRRLISFLGVGTIYTGGTLNRPVFSVLCMLYCIDRCFSAFLISYSSASSQRSAISIPCISSNVIVS